MRTSWKVGLWTPWLIPRPRARPRTKVVLPVPSSPARRSRSPGARVAATSSPNASVSAIERVTRSGKVLVAAIRDGALVAVRVTHDHAAAGLQRADGGKPRRGPHVRRPGADQLRLLPTSKRLQRGRARRRRHEAFLDTAAATRHHLELVQLRPEPVADI